MKMKFEYMFALAVIIVLYTALFGAFYFEMIDLVDTIIQAFIMALASVTTFYFTKHKPDKKDDEQ